MFWVVPSTSFACLYCIACLPIIMIMLVGCFFLSLRCALLREKRKASEQSWVVGKGDFLREREMDGWFGGIYREKELVWSGEESAAFILQADHRTCLIEQCSSAEKHLLYPGPKKIPLRPQIFIRFFSWICAVFTSTSHNKAKQEIFSQNPLSFSKLVVIVTAHDVVLDEGKNCLRSLS